MLFLLPRLNQMLSTTNIEPAFEKYEDLKNVYRHKMCDIGIQITSVAQDIVIATQITASLHSFNVVSAYI